MNASPPRPPIIRQRHRARRLAYWNGTVWAIGNGLVSTTLIVYLAQELGAARGGLAIALIIAAPQLIGVLRLAAPIMIGRLSGRKPFCLVTFLFSAGLLFDLPTVVMTDQWAALVTALYALAAIWCVYHLFQYLATVALWSWLADLAELRLRGRFLGRRGRWMTTGEAAAKLVSGLFVWGWIEMHAMTPRWVPYLIMAMVGACFMLAALIPLSLVPGYPGRQRHRPQANFRELLAPFADKRFRRLLLFGCWFSLANGLTQLAHYRVAFGLGIGLFSLLAMQTAMRCGQLGTSPWFGRLADRWGNRPVMIACMLLVAQGPAYYFLATFGQKWWIAGAWFVWVAYAGINVCLPNLMLKLAPGRSNTSYIAIFYAVTGLCYAANTLLGGFLADQFGHETFTLPWGVTFDYHQMLLLAGWITRCMTIGLLLLIIEE